MENVQVGAVEAYLQGLLPTAVNVGVKILLAIVIYFIGTKVIKVLRRILGRFLDKANVDQGVKQFLDSLAKVILYFCLIIIICGWFGIPTASVVALLGSAGLAIGLALQGSLANFAGGVLILVIKPFKVGDYIIEDNHGNEGTVSEIQLFYTTLTTPDNRVVIIPNGALANSSLTNVTRQDKRRVDLSVGVSYQTDLSQAKAVLTRMLENEDRRLEGEDIQVFVDSLEDSYVKLGCRVWVATGDYWAVKWHLTEEMKNQLDLAGIEIPYNQLEVSVKHAE